MKINDMNMQQIDTDIDFYFYAKELEQQWHAISPKLPDKELLTVFPEAKNIIPLQIKELKEQRQEIMGSMQEFQKQVYTLAAAENKDEVFVWFWSHAVLKYFVAPKVVILDQRLARLYMQQRLLNPRETGKGEDWQVLKDRAKQIPLADIATPYLQKVHQTGSRLTALCPFHKEKSPSFTIFQNTNTFCCFGCQAKGDNITFLMLAQKIDYRTAVKELAQ